MSTPDGSVAADLVARIGTGDREAEAELVSRYAVAVGIIARRVARDSTRAEDLAQETFRVTLVKARRGEILEPERLAGFLRGTIRRLHLSGYRKESRYTDLSEPSEPVAEGEQLRHLLADENARRVRELLSELRFDRDREVLVRYYLRDDDAPSICRELDLDPSLFNRTLYRARQRLRELWERDEKRRRLRPPPPDGLHFSRDDDRTSGTPP